MNNMGFCPICGNDTTGKNTFCSEHQEISLDYKEVVVRLCGCGRYFYRNRWAEFRQLTEVVDKIAKENIKDKNIKIDYEIDDEIIKKTFEIYVEKEGEEFVIPAKLQIEQCPVCAKKSNDAYFVSTVQIRPRREDILNFVGNIVEKSPNDFVSRLIAHKAGFDLRLSSNKIAMQVSRKLVKSFKGEMTLTRHLQTRDKMRSKDLFRVTVCFRAEEQIKT